MAEINEQDILGALENVKVPVSGESIVQAGLVRGLQVKDGHVAFTIEVDREQGPKMEPLRKEAEKTVHALDGVLTVTVVLTAEKVAGATPPPQQAPIDPGTTGAAPQQSGNPIPGVDAIVAVASGKGGVGKTWFAITLAHALSRRGLRTLLFDGDLGLANVDIQLGLMPKHDLGNVISPVSVNAVPDDFLASIVLEVHIDVWEFFTLQVQEPLKYEPCG